MSKRDYLTNMQAKLDEWNTRLAAQRVEVSEDEARSADRSKSPQHRDLDDWTKKGEEAAARLSDLRAAIDDLWDTMQAEMEKVWHAIEHAFDQAAENPGAAPLPMIQ